MTIASLEGSSRRRPRRRPQRQKRRLRTRRERRRFQRRRRRRRISSSLLPRRGRSWPTACVAGPPSAEGRSSIVDPDWSQIERERGESARLKRGTFREKSEGKRTKKIDGGRRRRAVAALHSLFTLNPDLLLLLAFFLSPNSIYSTKYPQGAARLQVLCHRSHRRYRRSGRVRGPRALLLDARGRGRAGDRGRGDDAAGARGDGE